MGWLALLGASIVGLHRLGGVLAPPPLTDPAAWGGWLEHREPAEAAVALLRLLTLASAWFQLAVTLGAVAARVAGAAPLVRAADALSTPLVRRLVAGAVGLSVSITTTATGGGTALAEPRPGAATAPAVERMRVLAGEERPAGGGPGTPGPAGEELPAARPPRMRLLAPAAAAVPAPVPAAADPEPRSWTMRPGDHLWAVAEQVLAEAWGRSPTDAEVDPYWRALVEANRSRLRDPGNPDLVFPGQVVTVPEPPARP